MGNFDDAYEKILRLFKTAGATEYELNARREALEFLFILLHNLVTNDKIIKQTKYLLNTDIMSDEEWQLFVEINWPESLLSENIN